MACNVIEITDPRNIALETFLGSREYNRLTRLAGEAQLPPFVFWVDQHDPSFKQIPEGFKS